MDASTCSSLCWPGGAATPRRDEARRVLRNYIEEDSALETALSTRDGNEPITSNTRISILRGLRER